MLGTVDITYGGKKYKVRFNNYSRFFFADKFGTDAGKIADTIEELKKKSIYSLLKEIVYAGVVGYALKKDEAPKLTEKQVAEYVADASDEEINELFSEFHRWFLGLDRGTKKKTRKTASP